MRTRRFALFALALVLAQPGHAFIDFKKITKSFRKSPDRSTLKQKNKQPGQEVHTFKLRKAKTTDLLEPLESYLNGLGGTGFITELKAENALVVTDFPETLNRLKILVPEIDQAYDHPNAAARKMIVTQNLMKAIRTRAVATGAGLPVRMSGAAYSPSTMPGATTPSQALLPSAQVGALVNELDEFGTETWRRLEESYSIQAFQVVGWVKDETGYTVVLNNQGERFLYRNGRIRYGYNGRGAALPGITGTIQGQRLTLANALGKVSLKMVKETQR